MGGTEEMEGMGGSPVGKRAALGMGALHSEVHRSTDPTPLPPPFPKIPPPNPRLHRAGGGGDAGLAPFRKRGRVCGNACAGRGMSSTSWLRSLDPIPGNVTGNSEWAGPAPERGALGGAAHPGSSGAHGDPRPARTTVPDPAGGFFWEALPSSPPRCAELSPPRPSAPFPAKFVP